MFAGASRAVACAIVAWLAASLSAEAQQLAALHNSPCGERIDLPIADPAAQIDACTTALANLPPSPTETAAAYVVRARAYEILNDAAKASLDYRAAVQQYDRAILFSDPNAVLYYRRAVLHHALGEVDLAIKDYDASIKLDANISLAFVNRGILLSSQLGNAQAALADFDKAVALAPSSAMALILRGQVHAKLGHLELAKADLHSAAALAPNLARAEAANGGVTSELDEKQRAVVEEEGNVPLIGPNGTALLFSRAVLEISVGENGPAIDDLNQVLKLQPRYAYAFFNLGYARFANGEYDAAVGDYGAALQVDPSIAMAYNNRCLARAIVGLDIPEALADCAEAVRRLPGLSVARETSGFLYLKLGDYRSALTEYEAALEIDPHSAVALFGRGIARLHLGNVAGQSDKMAALAIDRSIEGTFAAFAVR